MNIGYYLAKKLADQILGGVAFSIPATLYVHLFTAAPGPDGGGTEVTGGDYAATSFTRSTSLFPAADETGLITSGQAINLGTASGADWGTVNSYTVTDVSGNIYFYGDFTTPRAVTDGLSVSMPAGEMTLILT